MLSRSFETRTKLSSQNTKSTRKRLRLRLKIWPSMWATVTTYWSWKNKTYELLIKTNPNLYHKISCKLFDTVNTITAVSILSLIFSQSLCKVNIPQRLRHSLIFLLKLWTGEETVLNQGKLSTVGRKPNYLYSTSLKISIPTKRSC